MVEKNCTPFVRQSLVTTAVCCSVVGQGCLLGFPGVLLPQLERPDSIISVTKDQASWIAAVSSITMFFGYFLISPVMDRAGRKAAHYTVIVVVILGWMTMVLATNFEGLLIGKKLQGLAYRLFMPVRSILIGECTSPRFRGGFLAVIVLSRTFGILFVHLIGSITSYKTTSLIAMAFPFTSLLITMYTPESPSWLATQGNYEECRKAFEWLRGVEETPELEILIEASKRDAEETQNLNRIQELVVIAKKKEFYKPVVLMMVLNISENFAGGILMSAYAVTVLRSLMGPDVQAHLWMVILDTQKLCYSVAAIFAINRFKRRTMIFSSGTICIGSLLVMSGHTFFKSTGLLSYDSLWVPGIFISLLFFSLAMGMSSLPCVIAGEVFPLQYRSIGGSISLISCSGTIFIVLKTFPGLISVVGLHGTFIMCSGVLVACLAVAWFLLPETSGKTLLEIEEQFRGEPFDNANADIKESEPLRGRHKNSIKLLVQPRTLIDEPHAAIHTLAV